MNLPSSGLDFIELDNLVTDGTKETPVISGADESEFDQDYDGDEKPRKCKTIDVKHAVRMRKYTVVYVISKYNFKYSFENKRSTVVEI